VINKVAFEINGNQHYDKNGNLKFYYDERQKYFEYRGWKVINIHYLLCFKNDYIIDLIRDVYNNNSLEYNSKKTKEIISYKEIRKKEKAEKKIKGNINKEAYIIKMKSDANIRNQPKIEKILKSNIDFSKFGWVKEASLLLDLRTQKVSGWMKRYMPDFYKYKCFVRN